MDGQSTASHIKAGRPGASGAAWGVVSGFCASMIGTAAMVLALVIDLSAAARARFDDAAVV